MILAGALISIACMAYRECGNPIVGSIAFSIGLVLVCILRADLYTGKIGYAPFVKHDGCTRFHVSVIMAIMLILNLLTAALLGALAPGFAPDKLAIPLLPAFGRAVLCGILVFSAVEGWKRTKQIMAVAFPTAVFVLIGAEHCVADAFWISAAGAWSWDAVLWILVVAAGNSIGSIVTAKLVSMPLSLNNIDTAEAGQNGEEE